MSIWSKWYGIGETPPDKGAAIYKVRMVLNEKPVRIPRIGGVDKEGILFFGKTKNLMQRRRQLWATFSTGRYGHPEIALYLRVRRKLNQRWGGLGLEYSYLLVSNERKAQEFEAKYIQRYFLKFCEPPPFNRNIPQRS